MKTIRYGIIGFGHHAIKRMVPGFLGAERSQLAALYRRNPAKAAANAKDYSIPRVFNTAEELCASPEIDAVFIASPDSLHLADVLTAARHGKHVLCEKPLAMNAQEVEEMLAAAQSAGIRFGVAQNMRYYRSLDLVAKQLADGIVGKPVMAHAQFCYEAEASPRTWIYDPTLACGGPIGDVGIHCIDALRYVLETKVATVSTLALKDRHSGAVESKAVLGLTFTSGVMGAVTVTTRAAYRTLVEIVGESGVITVENGLTVDQPIDVIVRQDGRVVSQAEVSNADAYSRMLDSFSDEINGTGQYRAPATDGLHNQRILDAAYQSWRTGATQNIS
ncbi:MAG: Gfo/Idh/MocA family oxidoreductase [Acidobacteria bacterium]|nr:Gfo/Idh/MocA family oxidoreductase [Acidobacteriota bacterium]MBW4046114.1 Gfo/Idh/MocA family oxidoreductase [Acidobacteriota bacterium]